MSENKSLNRGLDALLGDQKIPTTTKEINLEKITAGKQILDGTLDLDSHSHRHKVSMKI